MTVLIHASQERLVARRFFLLELVCIWVHGWSLPYFLVFSFLTSLSRAPSLDHSFILSPLSACFINDWAFEHCTQGPSSGGADSREWRPTWPLCGAHEPLRLHPALSLIVTGPREATSVIVLILWRLGEETWFSQVAKQTPEFSLLPFNSTFFYPVLWWALSTAIYT